MDITPTYPILQGKYGSSSELHQLLMRYLWGPGANLAVIIVLYTYRKWWLWLHALFFVGATTITLITSIPILLTTGIVYPDSNFPTSHNRQTLYNHYVIGITCMVLMTLATGAGFFARIAYMASISPKLFLILKWSHRVGGYIVLILCKTNYYLMLKADQLPLFISLDASMVSIFLIRRLFFPKMESKQISPKYNQSFKQVQSVRDLDQSKTYVSFANYIYDAEPLRNNHPGGYEVIRAIRNKQMDRYIYGAHEIDELPEMPKRSHSFKSITLLGTPVAQLAIPQLFKGFDQPEVECSVVGLEQFVHSNGIFQLLLSKRNGEPFKFNKYRQISQLGRFYSLTLNNKITRLYTTVAFLVDENINFLKKYMQMPQKHSVKRSFKLNCHDVDINGSFHEDVLLLEELSTTDMVDMQEKEEDSQLRSGVIPVMFRVYNKGRFTKGITEHKVDKVIMSCERGEGLQLNTTDPGHIIMIAGGTGLFTFSDIIDLLYKEQLMINKPQCKKAVLKLSPILNSKPFASFTFELMLALNKLGDIHQITFEQLRYLADKDRIKLTFRIKDKDRQDGKNIKFTQRSFEDILGEKIDRGSVSKVWICGPPRMNQNICAFLRRSYHRKDLYLLA